MDTLREGTQPRLRTLLEDKEIRRSKSRIDILVKEVDGATHDLDAATQSLERHVYKWATIQAYHSMLHAARALLYRMGYHEQNDRALLATLKQLYEREIIDKMLKDLSTSMTLTQQLHDGLNASEDTARTALKDSENFLEEAARILAAPREWFEKPAPRLARTTKKRSSSTIQPRKRRP